ncbi:MAG: hypothetical protein IJI35_05980 [Kiritimatiellae bacterium]|nr:hypothetical protein [Kiritimatiellia bacterium]
MGYFVTPPGWAAGGGDIDTNSSLPQVDARYTLAGTNASLVRLNVPAALGMCATLDACAERWWVPLFSYPSPGHRAFYQYSDFYPGPADEWAAFNFASDPFYASPPLWSTPDQRVISNTFGRIFFRISDMLEDVRSRLRSLAGVYPTDSCFGPWFYGSSKFGGIDTVEFDWCERPDAMDTLREAFDDGLCLDWSCLSNNAWSGQYTAFPRTVAMDFINLDNDEFTNVVARCRRDAHPPLPDIYDILHRKSLAPTLSRSWLSYSNITSRISADDFGWMNRLLAALDKTYLVGGYDGLPIVLFTQLDVHGEVRLSQSLTNGYFILSLGAGDALIATLSGVKFADASTSSPVIQTGTNFISNTALFSISRGAKASLHASGAVPLGISASALNDLLPSRLGVNESVMLRFIAYPGGEGEGPLVDIIAWPDGENGYPILLKVIRILDVVSSVPVNSGLFAVDAEVDLSATGRSLPYAPLGAPWLGTNSIPHVRPLPDQYAPDFVSQVKLQVAARRDWAVDNMPLDEYAAFSGDATTRNLDGEARILAERVKMECETDASSAFDVDFSDIESSAKDVVRSDIAELRDLITETNGTWGVQTVDINHTAYLANAGGVIRLFLVDASGFWSEAPQLSEGVYLYANVVADCGDSVSTNFPSAELSAEYSFGAAVYWFWPALPHASTE